MAKKTAKVKKVRKQRYFGITKIKSGDKLCWLSKHTKNGWTLGLALNKRTIWLTNTHFATRKDLESVIKGKAKIVFVFRRGETAKNTQ